MLYEHFTSEKYILLMKKNQWLYNKRLLMGLTEVYILLKDTTYYDIWCVSDKMADQYLMEQTGI